MTHQEIFDTVVRHLAGLPNQVVNRKGDCVYRDEFGQSCAAGCLLTDEEAKGLDDQPNSGFMSLANRGLVPDRLRPHVLLIRHLQGVHDAPSNWLNNTIPAALRNVACEFDLNQDVITCAFSS